MVITNPQEKQLTWGTATGNLGGTDSNDRYPLNYFLAVLSDSSLCILTECASYVDGYRRAEGIESID